MGEFYETGEFYAKDIKIKRESNHQGARRCREEKALHEARKCEGKERKRGRGIGPTVDPIMPKKRQVKANEKKHAV